MAKKRANPNAPGVRGKMRPRGRPWPKGNEVGKSTRFPPHTSGNPAGISKAQAAASARLKRILFGDLTTEEAREIVKGIQKNGLIMGPERTALNLIQKNAATAAVMITGERPGGLDEVKLKGTVELSGLGGGPIQLEHVRSALAEKVAALRKSDEA